MTRIRTRFVEIKFFIRIGRSTDLYRLKERTTSTDVEKKVMSANLVFAMSKGMMSSFCNDFPFYSAMDVCD